MRINKIMLFLTYFKSFGKGVSYYFSSLNFYKVAQGFFLLFIAFLPFQIDALILTKELYFSGFFNPYLSHFIYISDLFLLLSFLFLALSYLFNEKDTYKGLKKINLSFVVALLLFLFICVFSLLFSYDQGNSMIYILRFIEFSLVSVLIAKRFVDLKIIFYVFIGVLSFEAFIGIFQYVLQESLGIRFFGEPIISSDILGVAKVGSGNEKILRIYGTFPHPNIFAGYLVVAIFMVVYCFKDAKKLFSLLLFVLSLALLLTFSRSAYMALAVGLLVYYSISKIKFPVKYLLFVVSLIFLFIVFYDLQSFFADRFLIGDEANFIERNHYYLVSKDMFLNNPLGVGIGNFTSLMQHYSSIKLMPWLYQPVHNHYMLFANEAGIQGLIVFLSLFFYCPFYINRKLKLKKYFKDRRFAYFLISFWAVIFIIGFFDHYLISLYQGQALMFLFVGFFGFNLE